MSDRDSVIKDLSVAKIIMCNQMLTPEMCIRMGQAITSAIDMLKTPDRIKVTRCKDCRFFEPSNAEEGDNSGHCRNDYAPCQNQTVDAWWFCGSAERVSE